MYLPTQEFNLLNAYICTITIPYSRFFCEVGITRYAVGLQILILQTLVSCDIVWVLRTLHSYYICRYYCWIEKPMLCRNCASHILPAIRYSIDCMHILSHGANSHLLDFWLLGWWRLSGEEWWSWPSLCFLFCFTVNTYTIINLNVILIEEYCTQLVWIMCIRYSWTPPQVRYKC